jgi:hypothetical protein
MSNYHDKYLKYKKKYIDLKTEYEGGKKDVDDIYAFFWSSSNKPANDIFSSISEKYTIHLNNPTTNLNQPYYTDANEINKAVNGVLNLFIYKLGSNKVEPFFKFTYGQDNKITYIQNLEKESKKSNKKGYNGIVKTESRRMQHLLPSFGKAINKYLDSSVIPFNDKTDLIIKVMKPEALKLHLDKIINFINSPDKLNPIERIARTKTLLEMVKLYQDQTTSDVNTIQKSTIGLYINTSDISPPTGTEGTIVRKEQNLTEDEKKKNTKIKLSDYFNQNIEIDLNLTFPPEFKFTNIDKTILLKPKIMKGKNQFEVLNIFPPCACSTNTNN